MCESCDWAVYANIGGIVLQALALLIVIWHDWQRERVRRQGRVHRRSLTDNLGASDNLISAHGSSRSSGSATATAGPPTLEDVVAELRDDLQKTQEQVRELGQQQRADREQLDMQLRTQSEQQAQIQQRLAGQEHASQTYESIRFLWESWAAVFALAGVSMQIGAALCTCA